MPFFPISDSSSLPKHKSSYSCNLHAAQSSCPLFLTPVHTVPLKTSASHRLFVLPSLQVLKPCASGARLSNLNEASLSQIFPSWDQTILSELIFSPLSLSSLSLQGSLISHLLPSPPCGHLTSTEVHHSSALVFILHFSHCCYHSLVMLCPSHLFPSSAALILYFCS